MTVLVKMNSPAMSKTLLVSLLAVVVVVLGSSTTAAAAASQDTTTTTTCSSVSTPLVPTPPDQAGPFYVANSKHTNRIGPESLLSDPAKRLVVRGRVLSSRGSGDQSQNQQQDVVVQTKGVVGTQNDTHHGCTGGALGVGNVNMEVWYAGEPNSAGKYYQDEEFRGQFVTAECGYYEFTQTFPQLYPSRPIFHIHVRLSRGVNGEGSDFAPLVTQLYFLGDGTGYVLERDTSRRRKLQSSALTVAPNGERSMEFDFYIDVDGDPGCGDGGDASTGDKDGLASPAPPTQAEATTEASTSSLSTPSLSRYGGVGLTLVSLLSILVFQA